MILIVLLLIMPFLGTTFGAITALFCKKEIAKSKLLIGFATGVMIAASVWSLLIPSLELTKASGKIEFLPASIGFVLGIGLMIALDIFTEKQADGRGKMLFLAITVHNIPEGMAVGAAIAGFIVGADITFAVAFSISFGVALQNIPEGAIVSLPLCDENTSRKKAFFLGTLSGTVEPIFAGVAIITYVLATALLPYMLSLAAGAMLYVAIKELAPEIKDGRTGIIGFAIGFILMMTLDVCL